jgi:glucose-6-phosphate isomerase
MFKINYSGVLDKYISPKDGLATQEIEYFQENLNDLFESFKQKKHNFGFCRILKDIDISRISQVFNNLNKFDNIVVLGIGGSALGTQAISNVYGEENHRRKLYVLDNVDPYLIEKVEKNIELSKTLFMVISKSGETVETLSQFVYFYDKVKKSNLNPLEHFIFITDPKKGFLRNLATKYNFTCLEVPEDVGGRFSVLSNVGLAPAYCFGVNIEELLNGAIKIDNKHLDHVFSFSLMLYLLNTRRSKSIVVMMPYCDRLIAFSQWFSQLWAESLGKKYGKNDEILRTGQTPIVARGVTDQHSQLQLYLEGPKDKVIILLKTNQKSKNTINVPFLDYDSVQFLNGKTFYDLFEAEYIGTYNALINEGIPTLSIEIENLNIETLGGLFYFFELCTAFSGELYEINPFDQPGVELGKKIAFGILGKKGYEEHLKNIKMGKEDRYVLLCD